MMSSIPSSQPARATASAYYYPCVASGLLVILVVLYWINGSLFPAAWVALFQLLIHLGELWSQYHWFYLLRVLITLLQSLSLLAAWTLFIYVSIREGNALFKDLQYWQISSLRTPHFHTQVTGATTSTTGYETSPIPQSLLAAQPESSALREDIEDPFSLDDAAAHTLAEPHDLFINPFEEQPSVEQVDPFCNPFEADNKKEHLSVPPVTKQRTAIATEWTNPFEEEDLFEQEKTTIPTARPAVQNSKEDKSPVMLQSFYGSSPLPGTHTPQTREIQAAPIATPGGSSTSTQKRRTETLEKPMPVKTASLRSHALSHVGITRAYKPNEDTYTTFHMTRRRLSGLRQQVGVFLVADGMGGYEHGKYASTLVIDTISQEVRMALNDPGMSDKDIKQCLVDAVGKANDLLLYSNKELDILRGTTITGAVMIENEDASFTAYIINVGDSRTYIRSVSTGFNRVTVDHSVVEMLIASHEITPEERYTDSRRNEIYRCIGSIPHIEVDVFTLKLQPHDRLLLCSDGLWEMVRDPDLAAQLAMPTDDLSQITGTMIQAALAGGGKDNVTAVVVAVSA